MEDKEANYGTSVKQFSRNFLKCMDILHTITNICLGAVAFAAIFIAQSIRSLPFLAHYSTHIILVTVGYILMMSQAVLSLNTTSGWAKAFKHHERKLIHLLLEGAGAVLAIAGIIYAITNANPLTDYTAHGIVGLIAMSLTILGSLGGAIHFIWPDKAPLPTRMIHSCVGTFALIAAFVTLILGLHKFGIYSVGTAWMYSVLAIIALFGTISSACIGNIRRLTR